MRVVVLANNGLKKELLAYPVTNDIDIQWLKEPTNYQTADACIDLLFENTSERVKWLKQLQTPLIIINSVIAPLKEIKEDFIRINGWNTFLKRPIIEAACKNERLKSETEKLFSLLSRKVEWVPDITGFITPRIVASIINEAFITLEEKVSIEKEIDTAMKLGTNYPYGPFEWGKQIGFEKVYYLLNVLQKEQTRYQPSDLLKQIVLAQ